MSRGFVKDGDQEDVPVVAPRAFLPKGAVNYVTPEGLESLRNEKIELVRELESLSGNESDRRVARNAINCRLQQLEERISSAVLWDVDAEEGIASFGSYITIEIEGSGKKTVRITGVDEANVASGRISYLSPLAAAINGHSEGEEISASFPSGDRNVRILSVNKTAPADFGIKKELNATKKKVQITQRKADKAPLASEPMPVEEILEGDVKPEFVKNEDVNEILPIVNERGVTIGRAPRWQCHDGSKLLHPVVHLHLYNSKGELYLQKRPSWKTIQPDKWDTAVGGHVGFGEKIEDALSRETFEEIGIVDYNPVFIKKYVFESNQEKELVYVFSCKYDGQLKPTEELDGGRFFSVGEIRENMSKKIFTPNFESEIKALNYLYLLDKIAKQ